MFKLNAVVKVDLTGLRFLTMTAGYRKEKMNVLCSSLYCNFSCYGLKYLKLALKNDDPQKKYYGF